MTTTLPDFIAYTVAVGLTGAACIAWAYRKGVADASVGWIALVVEIRDRHARYIGKLERWWARNNARMAVHHLRLHDKQQKRIVEVEEYARNAEAYARNVEAAYTSSLARHAEAVERSLRAGAP